MGDRWYSAWRRGEIRRTKPRVLWVLKKTGKNHFSVWKPPLHHLTPGYVPALCLDTAPAHPGSSSWCLWQLHSHGAAPQSSPGISPSGQPGAGSYTLSQWQTFLSSFLSAQEGGLRSQQGGLPPVCLCLAPFSPLPVLQVEGGCGATLPWHSQGHWSCWKSLHGALCGCRDRAGGTGARCCWG